MNSTEMINDFLAKAQEGNEHIVNVAKKLVGDKEEITFSMQNRRLQPEQPQDPVRQESPARAHVFHDIAGFKSYLGKYKTPDTVVMADVRRNCIHAILDEKAARGFEVVELCPMLHPLFVPWDGLLDDAEVPMKNFVSFLAKNKRSVVAPDGKSLVFLLSQIKASIDTTLYQGKGNNSVNGLTCKFKIAGNEQTEQVHIPDVIKVKTPVYVKTEPVEFEVDLIIGLNDEKEIVVECCSADIVQIRVDLFSKMLDDIQTLEGVVVTTGGPVTKPWAYLK